MRTMKRFKRFIKEDVIVEGLHAKKSPTLLKEAYSFFPTNDAEIDKELKSANWDKETIDDVKKLFKYLKKKDKKSRE